MVEITKSVAPSVYRDLSTLRAKEHLDRLANGGGGVHPKKNVSDPLIISIVIKTPKMKADLLSKAATITYWPGPAGENSAKLKTLLQIQMATTAKKNHKWNLEALGGGCGCFYISSE